MEKKYRDYQIGIDYGTSNSCVGIYLNGTIHIIPNKIGERTTPSIVCFTEENNDKALVGEEALNQKIDNYRNTIYEVKRFIGLNYDEFIENEYDKYLNYDVVNQNGIPNIKIVLNGKESFYSAEDISSFIIKKMVECAEDFLSQKEEAIKITKAIITVPAHFTEQQKNAVRSAAKKAGIEIPRIINEPTAAALAYGIGHNLVPKKETSLTRIRTLKNKNENSEEAPLAIERMKSKSQENALVFDLGGGTFDITLFNIRKNQDNNIDFEILATDGDIHLGGSDFDNKLIDYCIEEFCRTTNNKDDIIRQEKKAMKRLKIKCENAKKLLSYSKEAIINIDNFYKNEDLFISVTRNLFDDLCKDLYKRIENLILDVVHSEGKDITDIDEIILVGGATRIIGVQNLIKRIFGEEKIKDDLNPDEAVALGATLEASKLEEKDKINFVLQDIVAYNIGIPIKNPDPNDNKKNGELMYPIISKYSKIPFSSEKEFSITLNEKFPNFTVKIFEGNDKYVKKNSFLGEILVDNINKLGNLDYKVKLNIDVNGEITIIVSIESLGIKKEGNIKKFTHAVANFEKKKIKICKNKNLKMINNICCAILYNKEKINYTTDTKSKLEYLKDCCKNYEELISYYMEFIKNNESVYEIIFKETKNLFNFYIEIITLVQSGDDIISIIILKIRDGMKNLISQLGYIEDLLDMFTNIKQTNELKNIYYEIFINYMELMNSEGLAKKENNKFSRYYSKLYLEREFYSIKKHIKESDVSNMNEENRNKYIKEKIKNEEELKKINSFSDFIEKKIKEGEFLFGGTGNTLFWQKVNQYEKNKFEMNEEQIKEILDIFENMVDSFDEKENSIGEAYCISHIIFINYKFFHRGYDKLWNYINRVKTLLYSIENKKYDWINNVKEIIEEIENNKK